MAVPSHTLNPAVRLRAVTTIDAYGATVPDTWDELDFTAYVQQNNRSEVRGKGRDAETSDWLLVTNDDVLRGSDRVRVGDLVFQVEGRPWPVYGPSTVHHYEATLRLVEG